MTVLSKRNGEMSRTWSRSDTIVVIVWTWLCVEKTSVDGKMGFKSADCIIVKLERGEGAVWCVGLGVENGGVGCVVVVMGVWVCMYVILVQNALGEECGDE